MWLELPRVSHVCSRGRGLVGAVLLGGALACGSGAPAKSPAEAPAEAAPTEEAPPEGASAPPAEPSLADSAAGGGGTEPAAAQSGAASDDGLDADIAALSASTQPAGALAPSRDVSA